MSMSASLRACSQCESCILPLTRRQRLYSITCTSQYLTDVTSKCGECCQSPCREWQAGEGRRYGISPCRKSSFGSRVQVAKVSPLEQGAFSSRRSPTTTRPMLFRFSWQPQQRTLSTPASRLQLQTVLPSDRHRCSNPRMAVRIRLTTPQAQPQLNRIPLSWRALSKIGFIVRSLP